MNGFLSLVVALPVLGIGASCDQVFPHGAARGSRGAAATASHDNDGAQGLRTFRGTVREPSGGPAAGARLCLLCFDSVLATAVTDEHGGFELSCSVPRPELLLEVDHRAHPRLQRDLSEGAAAAKGDPLEIGELQLRSGSPMQVRVKSSLERSVGITDLAFSLRDGESTYLVGATTDLQGRADLDEVPLGLLNVTATAVLHSSLSFEHEHRLGQDLEIEMIFMPQLDVQVLDNDQQPLKQATVSVASSPEDANPLVSRTNGDGTTVIRYLKSPNWHVEVSMPGYETARRSGSTPEAGILQFVLQPIGNDSSE